MLTQDPIGLAGGVNLYEYAGSNPVSFDDPFGLSPNCPPTCDLGDAADLASGLTPGLSTAVDVATAVSGTNPITGDHVGVGGRLIALAGVLSPASGGEFRAASRLVTGAARALSERIGKNSVTFATKTGVRRVDLVGRSHGGLPTPHVQDYRLHTNPSNGKTRLSRDGRPRAATRQDVLDAARAEGQ